MKQLVTWILVFFLQLVYEVMNFAMHFNTLVSLHILIYLLPSFITFSCILCSIFDDHFLLPESPLLSCHMYFISFFFPPLFSLILMNYRHTYTYTHTQVHTHHTRISVCNLNMREYIWY